jgi:hypothetical protein
MHKKLILFCLKKATSFTREKYSFRWRSWSKKKLAAVVKLDAAINTTITGEKKAKKT